MSRNYPRLIARFRPQVWVNDQPYDLNDGRAEFDVTEKFLSLPYDKIRDFHENDYDADALAEDLSERLAHDGPFEVDTDIEAWLLTNGFAVELQDVTDQMIDCLRKWHNVPVPGVIE